METCTFRKFHYLCSRYMVITFLLRSQQPYITVKHNGTIQMTFDDHQISKIRQKGIKGKERQMTFK